MSFLFKARREKELSEAPTFPQLQMDTESVQGFLRRLQSGLWITKYTRQGKPSQKKFTLDPEWTSLTYGPTKKGPDKHTIYLSDLWEVRPGVCTNVMQKARIRSEQACLSLVFKHGRTIDLELPSARERTFWMDAIVYLRDFDQRRTGGDAEEMELKKLWKTADGNGDGSLNLREIKQLFKSLNIKRNLDDWFKLADDDHSGQLNETEFRALYYSLTTNKTAEGICKTYGRSGSQEMSLQELHTFLEKEQSDPDPPATVRSILERYQGGGGDKLSLRQFQQWLLSGNDNSWWNPQHLQVYQDMDQPLSHYFIASSHNTYLSGDQLQSESKVEMYSKALLRGCRCVELDCWDGPDGDPIVYHGHTRTSKIRFHDVIQTINTASFRNSPYPVILSLEVHTTLEQQARMAEIMRDTFGAQLAEPIAFSQPSKETITPNALQGKILVKAKMLPAEGAEVTADDDDDDEKDKDGLPPEVMQEYTASQREGGGAAPKGHAKIAKALSDCVYLKSVPCKDPPAGVGKARVWEISSHTESKVEKFYAECSSAVGEVCKDAFFRIYPKGSRVNSSNYNPQMAWAMGCQVVALNYQTMDFPLRLNEGKFLQNGRCGYILKPDFLRKPDVATTAMGTAQNLRVKVISGWRLPHEDNDSKGEVIDPYVEIILTGPPPDPPVQTTPVVQDNGFNPIWNMVYTLQVRSVELSLLTLRVMDKDPVTKDDVIAEATVPCSSLRRGYRSVPLHHPETYAPFPGAVLLCQFNPDW